MKTIKIATLSVISDGDEEKIGDVLWNEPEESDRIYPEKLASGPDVYIPGKSSPETFEFSVLCEARTLELLKKLVGEIAEYKICFHYRDPIEKRMVARVYVQGCWNFDGGISARLFLEEVEES